MLTTAFGTTCIWGRFRFWAQASQMCRSTIGGGRSAVGEADGAQRKARERLADADLNDAEREAELETVHRDITREGALCLPCHSQEPTLVDFAELGYSPRRVESLVSSAIVRQAMSIEAGRTFFLPTLLELDREP